MRCAIACSGSNNTGQRVGLPKIGAGLAGGDWDVIAKIIEEELSGENVTIVVLEDKH